jgi:cell division protein FtsL
LKGSKKKTRKGIIFLIFSVVVNVGISLFCVKYSTKSTAVTSKIQQLNRRVTSRRSQLENLKNKLAASTSQEYIMAQVNKYNLGLSASSRGQVKQISATMVSNSRFNRTPTVVAFTE